MMGKGSEFLPRLVVEGSIDPEVRGVKTSLRIVYSADQVHSETIILW